MDYKEKLRLAKEALDSGSYDKETIEYIFPELKESKDEEIRKALLRFHKSTIDIDGIKCEDILAWLEKQGEQNPIIEMKTPKESLGISSEEYNKIVDECIYGDDKSTRSEEDERTYKSVLYAFEHNYPLNSEQQKFIKSFKEKVQLKQEWSEEDEMYLTHVTNAVKRYFANPWRKDVIKWLKSLKARYI